MVSRQISHGDSALVAETMKEHHIKIKRRVLKSRILVINMILHVSETFTRCGLSHSSAARIGVLCNNYQLGSTSNFNKLAKLVNCVY